MRAHTHLEHQPGAVDYSNIGLFKQRSFEYLVSTLNIGENESLHAYLNGLVLYLRASDRLRAQESVEALVRFCAGRFTL